MTISVPLTPEQIVWLKDFIPGEYGGLPTFGQEVILAIDKAVSQTCPGLPSLEARIEKLLSLASEEIRPCKDCGVLLYFVRHNNGKIGTYAADGLNHFVLRPSATQVKTKGSK